MLGTDLLGALIVIRTSPFRISIGSFWLMLARGSLTPNMEDGHQTEGLSQQVAHRQVDQKAIGCCRIGNSPNWLMTQGPVLMSQC